MNNIVSIKNLSFEYAKETVLTDLNLKIKQGSIFGLVGKNGAGKTTLLEIMLGLIKPKAGTIKICGAEDSGVLKEKVGFIPDWYQGLPVESIFSFLSYLLPPLGLNIIQQKAGSCSIVLVVYSIIYFLITVIVGSILIKRRSLGNLNYF